MRIQTSDIRHQTSEHRRKTIKQRGGFRLKSVVCSLPSAFTLFELLVVIVIFGGIMAALMVAFLISESSYHTADSYVQVQQEARRAFDAMTKELREAGPTSGGTFANPIGGSGGTCALVGVSAVTVSSSCTNINTCDDVQPSTCNQIDFQIALGYDLSSGGCPNDQVCWGAPDAASAPQANWSVRYWIDTSTSAPRLVRDVFDNAGALQAGQRRVLANGIDTSGNYTTFTYDTNNQTVRMTLGIQEQAKVTGGNRTLSIGVTPGNPDLETLVKLRN